MSQKLPRTPKLVMSPMGGTPRLGKPLAYGGSGAIYQMAPNYGKPKSLGKINTPVKR
jgi:hypothetical protein